MTPRMERDSTRVLWDSIGEDMQGMLLALFADSLQKKIISKSLFSLDRLDADSWSLLQEKKVSNAMAIVPYVLQESRDSSGYVYASDILLGIWPTIS